MLRVPGNLLSLAGVIAAALMTLTAAMPAAAAGDIHAYKVFGAEVPTGPYKHPASFTELANGDLYLVYYGGRGEYANDTAVFGARLKKGETQWSAPRVIAQDPFRSVGNGVVWQAPDRVVWLFYVIRFGRTWSDSRIAAKVSRDNAETWSDSSMLHLEPGMMVRNRPIVLHNGDYLLPIYHETGHDTEIVGPDSTSLFLRYDVKEKSWSETNRIRSKNGNLQPGVVQIDGNYLVSYSRRGGGYGPATSGYMIRSESRDGGRTWAEGRDSQFRNPNAAIEFIRLKSGNLLLVYNDHMFQRTPLTAAISTDNDKTWPYRRNIREGKESYAYPVALQAQDGKIHLIWTQNRRSEIWHAVFTEEAILKGGK
jgi:predicted neuraminidase